MAAARPHKNKPVGFTILLCTVYQEIENLVGVDFLCGC
jgi:hypothetical protein